MSDPTQIAARLAAEREAANLAFYFGTSDLMEKYEKAKAATDSAVLAMGGGQ